METNNSQRCNTLVKYEGQVYYWDSVFTTRKGRMAEIYPVNGGEVIAVFTRKLRLIPTPGMKTTYQRCGSR